MELKKHILLICLINNIRLGQGDNNLETSSESDSEIYV